MSGNLHHAHHVVHALDHASKHDGKEGALAGAVGVAGTVATVAACAGLALTPIGWGVMLGIGAAAGGSGGLKKLRSLFD